MRSICARIVLSVTLFVIILLLSLTLPGLYLTSQSSLSAYPAPELTNTGLNGENGGYPVPLPTPTTEPPRLTILSEEVHGFRVPSIRVDEPASINIQEIPFVPNPRAPNEFGWTEWFFESDPMGTGCNYTIDRLYVNTENDNRKRGFWEIKWGKVSAAAIGHSNAAWVAGGGKDAANPIGNYPTKQMNTFMACSKSDLTGVDMVAVSMLAYIDLPDPGDYAEVVLVVNNRILYKARIDHTYSSNQFVRLDFDPWNLSDQVNLSNVVIYIDFKTDGDIRTGKGIWIDWIQARQYDEQLVCGYKNLEDGAFKGLNISSIDPSSPNGSGLLIRQGDGDSPLNRIRETGTKWVRFLFKPPNSSYITNDQLELFDFMVDSLCAQDISVLGVINHETIPNLNYNPGEAAYQSAFANTAGMLARHFQGRITHWEVWNEPDLQKYGSPDEPDYVDPAVFANLLNAAFQAIKDANNRNKVISGGLYNARPEAHAYFDAIYQEITDSAQFVKAPFDYFGLHPYSNGRNGYGVDPTIYLTDIATSNSSIYDTALDPFLRRMHLDGPTQVDRDATVWITELGWNSALNDPTRARCLEPELVTELDQARFLESGFNFLRNDVTLWNSSEPAVDKVFWYQFMNIPLQNDRRRICNSDPADKVYPWAYGLYESKVGDAKLALFAFQTYGFDEANQVHLPIVRGGSTANITVTSAQTFVSPSGQPTGDVSIEFVSFAASADSVEEYIEIRNNDTEPILLHNWQLEDRDGSVYTFPYLKMQPGWVCRIYTQTYYPQWCGFTIHSEVEVWADSGDRVTLKNSLGQTVDSCSYLATTTPSERCNVKVVIGEAGYIDDALSHEPKTVQLNHQFENPVIFIMPPSRDGSDISIVRLLDVQPDQFTVHIAEAPNHGSGAHTSEAVSFIVLEAGRWTLPNGTTLFVGTTVTNATVGNRVSNVWHQVNFGTSFNQKPVVLSQVQSYNDPHWVKTRQYYVTRTGFRVALEEESSKTSSHQQETIGWVALAPTLFSWDGNLFEAGRTANAVTHNWFTIHFGQAFSTPPRFISSMSTYNEGDNAHLRYDRTSLAAEQVKIMIEEDTTQDAEQGHNSEVVDYIAIEQDGLLIVSP